MRDRWDRDAVGDLPLFGEAKEKPGRTAGAVTPRRSLLRGDPLDVRAPTNGVDTSDAAAVSLDPVGRWLGSQVLAFIVERGMHGATCYEVEVGLGMRHATASSRCNLLAGRQRRAPRAYIRDSGLRRPTDSGRMAIVWVAVESVAVEAQGA